MSIYNVLLGVSGSGPKFICATGGTITTSGNMKIHKFTGSGTFTVNSVGCQVPLIILLLRWRGWRQGRWLKLAAVVVLVVSSAVHKAVSATSYTITVGGGGAVGSCSACSNGSQEL